MFREYLLKYFFFRTIRYVLTRKEYIPFTAPTLIENVVLSPLVLIQLLCLPKRT